MRYLFIGIFIISIIGGVVAWYLKRPAQGDGFLKGALVSAGVTQKESFHRQRLNELNQQIKENHQRLFEDVGNQQRFLEQSNDRIQSYSGMASDVMDKSNVDLLRLRSAMESLQNQNRLLIERGNELVKANAEQLKLRMNNLDQSSLSAIDTELNTQRFESMNENLMQTRRDYMNSVEQQSQTMNEQVSQVRAKLKELVEKGSLNQSSTQQERLDDLERQGEDLLIRVRENQQQLKDKVEESRRQLEDVKQRLKDTMNNNAQLFQETQERNIERARDLNQRTRDQIERLKQQAK